MEHSLRIVVLAETLETVNECLWSPRRAARAPGRQGVWRRQGGGKMRRAWAITPLGSVPGSDRQEGEPGSARCWARASIGLMAFCTAASTRESSLTSKVGVDVMGSGSSTGDEG